jgi:cytochrome c-type biogenesis protein CcmH/NrfG
MDVYDSLGEAYMNAGEKQLAIDNYKKSLELNPENDNAKEKLKVLQTPPAR